MNLYPVFRPLLMALDAETAHRLAILALKYRPPRPAPADDPILATRVFGLDFSNPVGIAAGFDKHGEVPLPLAALGFGFVELGSVTPQPQPGNPRPRVFRLPEDRAVINRYGFNSVGVAAFAANLSAAIPEAAQVPVGINLGKNKATPASEAASDFVAGATALAARASYIVINVSSPNTPGLRQLQARDELATILRAVKAALAALALPRQPPLLLKIAPDLADGDLVDVAAVAARENADGIIVSNTTIQRPQGLAGRRKREAGGLSGAPLAPYAMEALRKMRRYTGGRVPLVAAGGIGSGDEAYRRIRAGASLVQLYTALIYEGPGLVRRIKDELAARLRRDGFASVAAAVGADAD